MISLNRNSLMYGMGPAFHILRIILAILILYLGIQVILNLFIKIEFNNQPVGEAHARQEAREDRRCQANLQEYLGLINKGPVFGIAQNKNVDSIPSDEQGNNLKALVTNYEIQGVIWGKNPRAIIFDKTKKETITVGVKDSIGQIEISAIYNDHITLQLLGEIYDVKY